MNTRSIFLNSKNSTFKYNGDRNSNLSFIFDESISVPPYVNIELSIDSAVIPLSFYTVNENNNSLIIGSTTYTITEGNYTATQLKNTLNTLLSGYTITYNTITNKFTFVKSSGEFTISSSSTCLNILGFSDNSHTSVSSSLTSDRVIDLSGNNQIMIELSNFGTNNLDSLTRRNTPIFLSIPITVGGGSILVYNNTNNYSSFISNKYIQQINVRLLDEEYNELDLNDKHFSLVLVLRFHEDVLFKNRYLDLQNQFTKI